MDEAEIPVLSPGTRTALSWADRIDAIRARLLAASPRIHAITSPVAQNLTANGLLALGAVPSLTVNASEAPTFVAGSGALLLNLGMLDAERMAALPVAAKAAHDAGRPFVLDPVFADRSPSRRGLALDLLAMGPAILKMNASEAGTFLPHCPTRALAVITGETDILRLGTREVRLGNGHALMARVTATGCLLGAILAACLAVEEDAMTAGIAGVSLLNIAAEIAAEGAAGPGSFAVRLVDALAALDATAIRNRLNLEEIA
jgi:hydroxyethylthiazole kinase